MAIPDASAVGRVYRLAEPYQVGRESLRAFARAVFETAEPCLDVAAARSLGYPDLVAAPTFAAVVAQRAEALYLGDPTSGVDFSRVVHAEESIASTRPIVAGDELHATVTVTAVDNRTGISRVTTQVDLTDSSDQPVATVTSTLAIRHDAA